jgi:hypothetical protein
MAVSGAGLGSPAGLAALVALEHRRSEVIAMHDALFFAA